MANDRRHKIYLNMLKRHSDIIHNNLSALVENTDVSRVIPILLRKNVLTQEIVLRIMNPVHDAKLQASNFYAAVMKRGPHAFAKLRDALQESNHVDLANLLTQMDSQDSFQVVRSPSLNSVGSGESLNSGDSDIDRNNAYNQQVGNASSQLPVNGDTRQNSISQSMAPSDNDISFSRTSTVEPKPIHTFTIPQSSRGSNSNTTSKQSVVPFQLPEYYRGLESCIIESEVSLVDAVNIRIEERLPVKVVQAKEWKTEGPLCYKMTSYPRGCALVVNNVEFFDEINFPRRNGAENDARRLKDMLEQLYFNVECYENRTRMQMLQIVKDFSSKEELNYVDCVIVAFMSHGSEGASEEDTEIIGVDGIGLKTKDIVEHFSNETCRALIHKPKVFFFQACRGILKDMGVLIEPRFLSNRTETDGKKIESYGQKMRIRSNSDVFMAYAVPPGRPANRDIFKGTWFIQTIVDIFCDHAWQYDLEDMLKMVDNKIKNINNLEIKNFQAVATTTIGWNKRLYFNPGLPELNSRGDAENSEASVEHEGTDVVDNSDGRRQQPAPNRTQCEERENMDFSCRGCFSAPKCILN